MKNGTAERHCSKGCGRGISAANKSGICTACQKPKRYAKGGNEDSVLSRMGFGALEKKADEAPPATKTKRTKRVKMPAPPIDWQADFHALARALGLNPAAMLEAHCREWVESVRSRALKVDAGPLTLQLPAGDVVRQEA